MPTTKPREGYIPFVQFMRPDGHPKAIEFDTTRNGFPPEVVAMAWDLIEKGVVFEIEELRTMEISMEAMLDGEVIAEGLCANGPPVVASVEKLVRDAVATQCEVKDGQCL